MTGYMERYAVNRTEFIRKGGALTPNFWRAPTDNDYGAKLQHKYAAWKNPDLRLTSLKHETKEGQVVVSAEYDMRSVSAKLYLTYTINNRGAVKVNQKMVADKGKKASDMFRFGMQLVMPKDFEYVSYYGRGPVENYSNRNHSTDLGIYHQTVDEQFYPYIRPQETGTKTDIRWWKVLDVKGTGLQFVADAPFSASSLHYTIESLDEGPVKKQGHSQEVEKADLTNVLIDKAQMGQITVVDLRDDIRNVTHAFVLQNHVRCLIGPEFDLCLGHHVTRRNNAFSFPLQVSHVEQPFAFPVSSAPVQGHRGGLLRLAIYPFHRSAAHDFSVFQCFPLHDVC
jgi:hypothetical protein